MTPEQVLEEELKLLVQELIENYDALGMRASGEWANSLEIIINSDNGIRGMILGAPYTRQLESGRAPGAFPPPDAIEQWMRVRGIDLDALFPIMKKIAEVGTDYFQQGGTEIISAIITPERIQRIIERVAEVYKQNFVDSYIRSIKQIA